MSLENTQSQPFAKRPPWGIESDASAIAFVLRDAGDFQVELSIEAEDL